jgi:hypothetical protein
VELKGTLRYSMSLSAAGFCNSADSNSRIIVIPKRGFSREESAVSLPAASRFLADEPGFEMTKRGPIFEPGII